MRTSQILKIVLAFSLLFPLGFASAQDESGTSLPLWEIGLGIGAVHQPYYTGTKQTRTYALPVVTPVIRGKILKSDDKGLRAQLLVNRRYKFDLSADFNFAFDSDDVDLREGMDDVDNMLQLGPSLEINLHQSDHDRWTLNLPLRANLAIGKQGIESSGFTFSPHLTYNHDFYLGKQDNKNKWVLGASLGPQFGTADYHDVYYGVDPEFQTATRSAYASDSGYSGSRLQLTLKSRNRKRFMLWFLRYENIDGARFDDSPLVETHDNLTVGFLYSRYLFKSKQQASY